MAIINNQIDHDTFLGKLFDIGLRYGAIVPHFDENEYYASNEYLEGIGVNNNVMNTVLSNYVKENENLYGKIKIVSSRIGDKDGTTEEESKRIRNEIVEIVKTGRPVLMGGQHYDDTNGSGKFEDGEPCGGHLVVAYDYDEENGILYGNFGWGSGTTHSNIDEYFNKEISDYWAFKFDKYMKKRTNNYIFTDKTSYYAPAYKQIYNNILPADYGYSSAYNNEEITKDVILPNTNEVISTTRLRTGYIEGESINLSTRRVEPGLAYLEYTFDKDLEEMDINLAWWSSDERVSVEDSTYLIEFMRPDGNYFELLDLWDAELPTDRTVPKEVILTFPPGVRSIRFYATSSNPVNDRNKGRLSIFDIFVIYYQ